MIKYNNYFDSISDKFEEWVNPFDLTSRLNWFSNQFDSIEIKDKLVLDVGCGMGSFSKLVRAKCGIPVPFDISRRLIMKISGDLINCVNGDAMDLPFKDNSFELVVSSECIEHTCNPTKAIKEMERVLAPDGIIILTTPNKIWRWTIPIAKLLRLRNFNGIENWLSRKAVRRALKNLGMEILFEDGLYLFPFQFHIFWPLLEWLNKSGHLLKSLMINQCWVVKKSSIKNIMENH